MIIATWQRYRRWMAWIASRHGCSRIRHNKNEDSHDDDTWQRVCQRVPMLANCALELKHWTDEMAVVAGDTEWTPKEGRTETCTRYDVGTDFSHQNRKAAQATSIVPDMWATPNSKHAENLMENQLGKVILHAMRYAPTLSFKSQRTQRFNLS